MRRPMLLALVLVAPGCEDRGAGAECRQHAECELPLSCIDGACVLECRATRDCERGSVCFEGACFAPIDTCTLDEDCRPFGQVCDAVLGRCVLPEARTCHPTESPCSGGLACRDGRCQVPIDSADAQAPRHDARVIDAAPADAGDAPPDARPRPDARPPLDAGPDPDGAPTPDAGPPGEGEYGDPCRCGSDCRSGFCVENKLRATRTCTDRCPGGDVTCPGLDTCVGVELRAGGGECPDVPGAPPPGTVVPVCIPNDTGFPCAGPQQCTHGICTVPPQIHWFNAQSTCSAPCEDDRKCPDGFACQLDQNLGRRICTPAVMLNQCQDGFIDTCGGTCPGVRPEEEVDVTFCVVRDGAGPGYCTCSCRDGRDCPTGFACSRQPEFGTGDPARPALCVPLAGYRCPGEVAEPNVSQCPSTTCASDPENPPFSACTTPCRDVGDCPRGYDCRPVEDFGTFCLPANLP